MYLFNRPFFIHTPLSLIWWERVTQAKKIPLDPICSNVTKQFQSDCNRAAATKFQSQNQILAPNAHCSQQNLWFQMKISLSNKIQTVMPFYMERKKGKGGIESFSPLISQIWKPKRSFWAPHGSQFCIKQLGDCTLKEVQGPQMTETKIST